MTKKNPTILGGAMIAAGTMIGAGMLTLPIVSAGMWFSWTMVIMMITMFFMQNSAESILEVNLTYPEGASFHTLVKDNLGVIASIVNGLSIMFVLYILLYAYVDGSGSVLQNAIKVNFNLSLPKSVMGFVFTLCLSLLVWLGARAVDRVSTVLMCAMFVTLFAALTGLLDSISLANLFQPTGESRFSIYAFASLPFYLTSFCFHASVPSFVKYYGRQGALKIRKAILLGMVLTLIFYGIWMLGIMGNITRIDFLGVIGAKDDLVWLLNSVNLSKFFRSMLEFFMFFAVVTSFIGAGLGLFDYIADLCHFEDSNVGRTKTGLVTFIPPIIFATFLPGGFLIAIGFAGLFAAIWSVIIPSLTVIVHRKKDKSLSNQSFRAFGGYALPYLTVFYGFVAVLSHILVAIFKVDFLNFFAS